MRENRRKNKAATSVHDGYESEWTPGVGDGQGGLACCDSWGCKELDMAERLNWTEHQYTGSRFSKIKIIVDLRSYRI